MSLSRGCVYILFLTLSTFYVTMASACELCTVPRVGKQSDLTDSSWFAEYYFEAQDWKEIDPEAAHELHESGHHVHDKTKEYIHHYSLGKKVNNELTVIADLPYVIRKSLQIHEEDSLGARLRSEGLGDLHVLALYQLWGQDNERTISGIGGIKFPTGETNETTPEGERFETELQPGSGSFDYIIGGLFKEKAMNFDVTANLLYVFKTAGAQDYAFGDSLISSLLWEYSIPVSKKAALKLGIDGTLQVEQEHEDHGATVKDSGGTTLLLGPTCTVGFNERASIFGSLQFPAVQKLGGNHQEVELVWNAGIKLNW